MYPIEKNAYNDFAFSVKIPEYMEFGLPVVAVNCAETAKFVEKYQIGRVCEDTAEDFAQKIRDVFSDPAAYRRYAENVARCAAENTWKSRAEEVLRDLVPQGGFPCR